MTRRYPRSQSSTSLAKLCQTLPNFKGGIKHGKTRRPRGDHHGSGDYLQVIGTQVAELPRADLLLIENQPEVAERLLHHLRGLTPALSNAPAVLAMPDTWNPTGDGHLAWPRTRTIVMRRMGALTTSVCVKRLRALYAM